VVKSELPEGANAVYEVVLDALDLPTMETAMRAGVRAACRPGVLKVTAGNYGGKLGPFHLHLHKLLAESSPRQ
jgi:formylmethanofuran--tetrahydromethanopterin N-formyltransferase